MRFSRRTDKSIVASTNPCQGIEPLSVPDPGQFAIGQMLVVVLALTVLGLATIRMIVSTAGPAGLGSYTWCQGDEEHCVWMRGCARLRSRSGIFEQGSRTRRAEFKLSARQNTRGERK
jgi:hypothetical protein